MASSPTSTSPLAPSRPTDPAPAPGAPPAAIARQALPTILLGLVAVLAPFLLDRWAVSVATREVETALGRRLGGQASLASVRPLGVRGVVLEGLVVRFPGPGLASLHVPALTLVAHPGDLLALRLRPALARATGIRLRWDGPRAWERLRDLADRLGGRRTRAGSAVGAPGRRLALDLGVARVDVRDRSEATARRPSRLLVTGVRLTRDAGGRYRATGAEVQAAGLAGLAVSASGIDWQGLGRAGGGLRSRALRVARAFVTSHHAPGARAQVSISGEELAPDLMRLHVVSRDRAAGSAARLDAALDVDGVKRSLRAALRAADLPLAALGGLLRGSPVDPASARVTGSVSLGLSARGLDDLRLDLAFSEVRVEHPLLAERVVTLRDLGVEASASLVTRERRLVVSEAAVRLRRATVRGRGQLLVAGRRLRTRVDLDLPPTPCQAALDAVPEGLAPALAGMRLAGQVGGRLSVDADSRTPRDVRVTARAFPLDCRVTQDPPAARVEALRGPITVTMRPPGWPPTPVVLGPASPDWRPLPRLGRHVVAAFLAAEDQRFFEHRGFDLENITRALGENLERRTLRKGASSISQQLVKNVFLTHRRTLGRKLEETVLTWRLEQALSKERILELYLNLVELGPGLFGVPAAARAYFLREPQHLSPLEAAHLAAVTPSPRVHHARMRSGKPGMEWLLHLRFLLYQMHKIGRLEKSAYEKARVADLRLITPRRRP
jgi:hypothetical protein